METLVFTGGHHTGALEVAKRLKKKVGGQSGLEASTPDVEVTLDNCT